ncbi:MAG TPA: DUF1318 domain-containing protein [Victivallales bacterium]|nr:DUF1318 domain-containing protein [Victivallales bacterium]
MKKSFVLKVFLASFFACVTLFSGLLFAEMDPAQRLAIIKALKKQGVVGENNMGYLVFKGAVQAKEVVDEENAVRKKAYESIANNTKVAVGKVGANRAAQIAAESPEGTWIELPDGRWVKK